MMKIGIMGTRGIPNRYGGFEQFAEYLSTGLAMKGHEVYVYNSSLHPYQINNFNGVNIIHCYDAENWLGTAGQFIYDRNCLNDAAKRNFQILLHLGYTSDSIFFNKWTPSTLHIVNMDGMEWKRSKYNAITRKFLKKAETLAVKHADVLVADSIGIQEHLKKDHNKNSIYIPYGASPFENSQIKLLDTFDLIPGRYGLVVARMEPENNIEMIVRAWINSRMTDPLLVISNTENAYGEKIQHKYNYSSVRFVGSLFDKPLLDNLRYFSRYYFHGHTVGGTNPSLLEAMACNCNIIAHDNIFNRSVLGDNASFFTSSEALTEILINQPIPEQQEVNRKANLEKIKNNYTWPSIINRYEELMIIALKESLRTVGLTSALHQRPQIPG